MTMKKIEEMTIPEMVDRYLDCQIRGYLEDDGNTDLSDVRGEIAALSRALDAKCEEAGISLQNKGVEFHRLNAWQMDYATMSRPVAVFIDNAADLHALLGYLLDKQR